MIISLIAAIAKDFEIGKDNDLLWRLKDDMKLFRSTTMGHAIVMGRKSFESIGKPLPGRRNIIITRSKDYQVDGAEVLTSITDLYELFQDSDEEIFILGGGQIYRQTLDDAHKMYLSHVDASFPEADTHFPKPDFGEWDIVHSEKFEANDRNEHAFEFKVYVRKP